MATGHTGHAARRQRRRPRHRPEPRGRRRGRPDRPRRARCELASGKTVDGYSLNGTSPGPLIEATVGQLVEVRLRNETSSDGVALHWHGVDVPNAEDGVAGVTQDAVEAGEDHTYRWVAPARRHLLVPLPPALRRAGDRGLLGGIIIHPEGAERRGARRVALAHLYDGDATVNGRHGHPARGGRGRASGSGCGWSTPTTASRTPGRAALPGARGRRVSTSTSRPRSPDRSVVIPAGGRADLEVQGARRTARAVRVELLGRRGLVIGPAEQRGAAPSSSPRRSVDLLDYGAPAPVGFDAARPDRELRVLRRPPPRVPQRPARPVVERQREALPGHADGDGARGRRRADADLQPQRREPPDAPARPPRASCCRATASRPPAARGGSTPSRSQHGESFDVAFLADNPGVWMDHCHNLKHATRGPGHAPDVRRA